LLAEKVQDISAHPKQMELKQLWLDHNELRQKRIMVLCYPEDAWSELVPPDSLSCTSPVGRIFEWHLRHLIYRWEHIGDDFPIEPIVNIPLQYQNTGWGMQSKRISVSQHAAGLANGMATPFSLTGEFCRVFAVRPKGAYRVEPCLKDPSDIDIMKYPEIIVDEEQTKQILDVISAAIGDLLQVRVSREVDFNLSLIGTLNELRGMEQVMLDVYDRPEWLHEVMAFMTEGSLQLLKNCQRRGLLALNNNSHYTGSGGTGYTNELPSPGFNGAVRLKDCWGFATIQSATHFSPRMQLEFVLQYQAKLLSEFGLNSFGCCEVLNRENIRYILQVIKNLRRISVSPFTDLALAADELGDQYVFSWKHNPTYLLSDYFAEADMRRSIEDGVNRAKGCNMEIIMKDVLSMKQHPERLKAWVDTVRTVIENR
jgi:hypothetical protein